MKGVYFDLDARTTGKAGSLSQQQEDPTSTMNSYARKESNGGIYKQTSMKELVQTHYSSKLAKSLRENVVRHRRNEKSLKIKNEKPLLNEVEGD